MPNAQTQPTARQLRNRERRKNAGSSEFKAIDKASDEMNETNDCAVKAVSLVTELPYKRVHAVYAKHGRKPRRGVKQAVTLAVLKELGYRTRFNVGWKERSIKAMAKEKNYHVANLTTRQIKLFPDLFQAWGRCLVWTNRHISAMIDGQIHDYTEAKAKRVKTVHVVTPVATVAPAGFEEAMVALDSINE